ncbi:biotin operon repressor [Caulobacter ginsengisoli]|uniref:Biotin operon repressor n=1 Tax=Caulobacter ginsengisoli TaxID=400775 RepID=A0ABU0IMY4_9CAUL|nr:helix-turn-helix domain containing protein [Caulobacter ginsengisoli]MDQ0463375.1 biotin operon repressor [Caulobacter ginsengisoli]
MYRVVEGKDRAVGRLTGQFCLDWIIAGGRLFGGEAMLGVAFMTLLRANIRDLGADPELNGRSTEAGPPRIPISARALAESLSISRETARRYVARLTDMGFCQKTDAGLFASPGALNRPEVRVLASETMALLDWLLVHLAELAGEAPGERLTAARSPMGLMVACDFVLRWAELIARPSQKFQPIVLTFQAILQGNIGHMIDDPGLRERYANDPPPDELRRPVTAQAVARVLGASREAVRTHIQIMKGAGYIARVKGGMIVPRQHFFYEGHLAVFRADLNNLRRMLGQLRDFGLLVPA